MPGYTKLFNTIVTSTIWREPDSVRLVWITMLALSDRSGEVHASLPGLADAARVSIQDCKEALSKLSNPDEYSRTPDNEGRRIEPFSGGWLLLNYGKYRKLMSQEERREYFRVKKAEQRERDRSNCQTNVQDVKDSQGQSKTSPACPHIAESREQRAIVKPQPSVEGLKFSEWAAAELFPISKKVPSWKEDWARCYDDMIRLDARTKQQVKDVCLWAIQHDIWRQHFNSPLKLRRRNPEKVMYFDVFLSGMKPAAEVSHESFL